ncbi:MAG: hypothetical protein V8R40_02305 [Dysosmobacter sp.]
MNDTRFDTRSSEWIGDMTVWLRENSADNSERLEPAAAESAPGPGPGADAPAAADAHALLRSGDKTFLRSPYCWGSTAPRCPAPFAGHGSGSTAMRYGL